MDQDNTEMIVCICRDLRTVCEASQVIARELQNLKQRVELLEVAINQTEQDGRC